MTGWTDDTYEVECPMPDCTNQLDLLIDGLITFAPEDLRDSDTDISIGDCSALSWRVECRAGHVILLPTEDTSCGCDDDRIPAPDGHEHWSEAEEYRAFHGRDMARLRAIITTIDGAR